MGKPETAPKNGVVQDSLSFLFVENFDAHFGSQKTATKLAVAKQPTFSKFVTVFNDFLPTSNAAHAADHTTFRSETTPRLFQAQTCASTVAVSTCIEFLHMKDCNFSYFLHA